MKKILTLILLTALLSLGFTGCDEGTPELSDAEAMQVLGYAASIANPLNPSSGLTSTSSPSIRAAWSETVTLTSPDGGSVSVSYDFEYDGSITGSVDYNGLVVVYNGKKYTLNGSYDLSMDYNTMGGSGDTMTVTSTYSLTGSIEISGAGTASFDYALNYTTNVEMNMTTGAYTMTMTVTGTMGGTAVDESYNITM